MLSYHRIRFATTLLIFAAVPAAVYGHEYGPPPGVTGAPGDLTCAQAGCHSGTPNSGPGNVKILLPGGNAGTYVPGQVMQLLIQITDTTKRAYGFELTARLASNPSKAQAGNFAPTDANTQVVCPDGSTPTGPCPSLFPIQDIEQTLTGFNASINTGGSFTYTVNWTPPASATAGNVVLYVMANCGIGNPPAVTPTNIYKTSVTLAPAAASNAPSITNVQNGASYLTTDLAPNTYAVIYGSNLSTNTKGRTWASADFTQNADGTLNMPTSLDGTSVTVGGAPAYVNYISPTQVNIITPPNVTGSNVPVFVTVNGAASANFNIQSIQSLAPSFFTWQPATSDSGKYLIAEHADYSYLGKTGLFPGTAPNFTTPAKPGETILLYGTGFGPTSPPIRNGIETDKYYALSPAPSATLGGIPAPAVGGLIQTLSQVYQLNVTIPSNMQNGDWPLVVTVGGVQSVSGLITVQGP